MVSTFLLLAPFRYTTNRRASLEQDNSDILDLFLNVFMLYKERVKISNGKSRDSIDHYNDTICRLLRSSRICPVSQPLEALIGPAEVLF